jgi:outer membrane biosynthesis protein TonB
MKGPSLQKTAAFSAALHVSFLLLFAIAIKQSYRFTEPSPYMVSLVSPAGGMRQAAPRAEAAVEKTSSHPAPQAKKTSAREKPQIPEKIDQQLISDRIAAIRAKKRIEKIYRLRQEISISRSEQQTARQGPQTDKRTMPGTSGGTGNGGASYGDVIRGQIYNAWFYPDTGQKDLETIVSIRIMKDGTIPLRDIVIEKKSGNRLFDKFAFEAIAKASPVSPPPEETEVVIRFAL